MELRWIFGSSQKDFSFLLLPGFLALLLGHFFTFSGWLQVFFLFLVFGLIDSGHGYLSFFRVLGPRQELSMKLKAFLIMAILVVAVSFAHAYRVPYLSSLFIYFTFYHHVRQFEGLLRWYSKINQDNPKWRVRALWLMVLTLALVFHMRPEVFSVHDTLAIISWPTSQKIQNIILIVFLFTFLFWVSYELLLFLRNKKISVCALFLLPVILLHVGSFLLGHDMLTTIFPLLIVHGVSYWFLVQKVLPPNKLASKKSLWTKMFLISLIFGLFDFYLTHEGDFQGLSPIIVSLVVGLTAGPNLWHYIVDAWLWKSKDPDMKSYYSTELSEQLSGQP